MRLPPARRNGRMTVTGFGVAIGAGRLCAGLLAVIVFSAPPAFALSVFDAIQLSKRGYTDQAIIDLIDATDSAFALEAADLPKLKQLGLSEPVIRAMLKRAVPVRDRKDLEVAPAHADTPRVSTEADGPFTLHPLLEKRGGGHVHLSLAMDGLEFLVLRDEGGYASIESRGRAIVARLDEVWGAAVGHFRMQRLGSGAQIVFLVGSDQGKPRTIRVMSVSTGDAQGYELRSGRSVTRDLLARYWADLLSDLWAVAHDEPPERLLTIHEGEALTLLREARSRLAESDRTLRAAADGVPGATRHHLQRLARTVPLEYGHAAGH